MQEQSKIIRLKAFSGVGWHNVDLDKKTCDCSDFRTAGYCGHLNALGIHIFRPFAPKIHPTFSQALSGLVKSLRIRRVEEAVYWLHYLDTFPDAHQRYRVARRLIIGTAEDGLSIPVMERCVENFPKLSKFGTDLVCRVAEAVRICKLPNWWDTASGGHDYIYQSLVGQRKLMYLKWGSKLADLLIVYEKALEEGDKATALGAAMIFGECRGDSFGSTRQTQYVFDLAKKKNHDLAARVAETHLKAKSALSGDNNFITMATWMMAGGTSPVALKEAQVSGQECTDLMDKAKERWQHPNPIPGWCCDGIHCAGTDARFAGILPQMYAVCRAFKHYGRVDPTDAWLPDFMCYDGLTIDCNQ
jgi:hypothetical protein